MKKRQQTQNEQKKEQQTLAKIAAVVGIVGGFVSIVVALTGSNPTFGWIALGIAILALAWYFAKGSRETLIIALLAFLNVAAIGVTWWLGPVTVEITVYIDQNGNGIREGGEPTVGPGLALKLRDSKGVTRDAATDERGIATFLDVPQGSYGLQFGAPAISGKAMRFNTDFAVPVSPTAVPPSPTAFVTPTVIPTETVSATPTPQCSDDLVNCSTKLVPIFVSGKSSLTAVIASRNLIIDFKNDQIGSGLAVKFAAPLDVRGFRYLEITGTSVETCTFVIEYKIHSGNKLTIVNTSDFETFDGAAGTTQSFRIPIAYNGEIDEIAVNFYNIGEASTVVIESMRLSQ